MGQRLTGACCTTTIEPESQVIHGLGNGSEHSRAIFVTDDGLACNVSQAEGLTPKSSAREDGGVLVKESTNPVVDAEGAPQCFVSCCSGAGVQTPTSRLVNSTGRKQPQQQVADADAEMAVDMAQAQMPVDPACGSPRCCNSPSSCAESEWNSMALIKELNSRAASLSLEFAPMPAAGTAFPTPVGLGALAKRRPAGLP